MRHGVEGRHSLYMSLLEKGVFTFSSHVGLLLVAFFATSLCTATLDTLHG